MTKNLNKCVFDDPKRLKALKTLYIVLYNNELYRYCIESKT